jgi:hypothetical protein
VDIPELTTTGCALIAGGFPPPAFELKNTGCPLIAGRFPPPAS